MAALAPGQGQNKEQRTEQQTKEQGNKATTGSACPLSYALGEGVAGWPLGGDWGKGLNAQLKTHVSQHAP